MTRPPIPDERLKALIHPRERFYLVLVILSSLLIYAYAIRAVLALQLPAATAVDPAAAAANVGKGVFGFYVVVFVIAYIIIHGHFNGHLRGNGVRVTERQFPLLNRMVEQYATTLGLSPTPPVYVLQAGGVLNAFATKFFSRSFVVLYSDVVALAEAQGEDALGFVVGHELAHIKRGHLSHQWLKIPGMAVPYLGKAYSRAREFTCDRYSAECAPEGAVKGLLVLAAGRSLYRRVDPALYAAQVATEDSFWVRRAEIASTHPHLPHRIEALLAAGIPAPVPD